MRAFLMKHDTSGEQSWRELLASPARASHILQLYDGDGFLAAAVAHFAAEGLKRGEAVLLTPNRQHAVEIRSALRALDVDARSAECNGQLVIGDVEEALNAVMVGGAIDAGRFTDSACAALDHALGDPRFGGARWWGEMTTTLCRRGEIAPGLQAERLADDTAKRYGATVFCSHRCDHYDARGYDATLIELCSIHSHVIPADDYAGHRRAVNQAIAEVVGEVKGALLHSLVSWKGPGCHLPSSQALLFWVRDTMPERFDAVLERARRYHDGVAQ
jgi:hypothetical protein